MRLTRVYGLSKGIGARVEGESIGGKNSRMHGLTLRLQHRQYSPVITTVCYVDIYPVRSVDFVPSFTLQ